MGQCFFVLVNTFFHCQISLQINEYRFSCNHCSFIDDWKDQDCQKKKLFFSPTHTPTLFPNVHIQLTNLDWWLACYHQIIWIEIHRQSIFQQPMTKKKHPFESIFYTKIRSRNIYSTGKKIIWMENSFRFCGRRLIMDYYFD